MPKAKKAARRPAAPRKTAKPAKPASASAAEANAATLRRLYVAFQERDGRAMAACYAPDATFQDPVFAVAGADIGRMWAMLAAGAPDLRVEASDLAATAEAGTAHWEAWYTFSRSGRKVHNVIRARFTFRDGRIATHVDAFPFWRWSRQALGPVGWLLGWTPLLRRKVRKDAARRLALFAR
jgi:ketosteroid isomerase-like protein